MKIYQLSPIPDAEPDSVCCIRLVFCSMLQMEGTGFRFCSLDDTDILSEVVHRERPTARSHWLWEQRSFAEFLRDAGLSPPPEGSDEATTLPVQFVIDDFVFAAECWQSNYPGICEFHFPEPPRDKDNVLLTRCMPQWRGYQQSGGLVDGRHCTTYTPRKKLNVEHKTAVWLSRCWHLLKKPRDKSATSMHASTNAGDQNSEGEPGA